MSYYGNAEEMARAGDRYGCNCIDGECSGCGECCADFLPMTEAELQNLKDYTKKHNLKEHRQAPFWDRKAVDFTCPFRNQLTRKCDAYPARPYICRTFICSKSKQDAIRDRGIIHASRKVYSLRREIFGNEETVAYVREYTLRYVKL